MLDNFPHLILDRTVLPSRGRGGVLALQLYPPHQFPVIPPHLVPESFLQLFVPTLNPHCCRLNVCLNVVCTGTTHNTNSLVYQVETLALLCFALVQTQPAELPQ